MKTPETLVSDIYDLVDKGFTPSEENLNIFARNTIDALVNAFQQGCNPQDTPTLRMSSIGTPNRKLWYMLRGGYTPKRLKPWQALSFMYGHIIEQMILLLARESGHVVTEEQRTVELEGVVGHIDCKIDGVLIDVKGMSNFNFQKFMSSSALAEKDSFGYIPQISGYAQALEEDAAGFFAFNKERGTLVLCMLGEFDLINARGRIQEVREMLSEQTPPQRCFTPIPDGKSGNLILDKPCVWCPFHKECWKDANEGKGLRVFEYSNGPRFFVRIEKEPTVEEITNEKDPSEED